MKQQSALVFEEEISREYSNETRIDSIKMSSLNSSFSLTKPLKSVYGKLSQPVIPRMGFTFEFHAININKKFSQFNLRDIPQILESFDKPGQEKLAELVNKIETLFLHTTNYQRISVRFCLKKKNTHVFCSAAYGKGLRIFSTPMRQPKEIKFFS